MSLGRDDYEKIMDAANIELRKSHGNATGQTIEPWHFIDWHVMKETERYVLNKLQGESHENPQDRTGD